MKRNFLFIKSTTESTVIPVDSFSHAEYTSDTTVTVYFDAKRSGKDATIAVVLTVSSGKANDVITRLTNQITSGKVDIMRYDASSSPGKFHTTDVTGITSITTTEGPAQLVPSGGDTGEVLTKDSATDYDVSWQDVHTLYVEVRNQSGGTLAKGTPVHATGATGDVADVIAARADTASAMPATYVLNEEIADGANGQAIISGTITGVDTSSFSPGDVIYVGPTGGFVNVKPTGTNLIQNLGVVTRSNANTGSGVVLGAGRSNDVPNIADGYAWIGNASGVATATQLADVATSGAYSDISGTPTLATVATSGSYNDLSDTPAPTSSDLVDDTTPQLGGDLDVNGNKITSASNGNITIDPDGTGAIIMKSDSIQFDGAGSFSGAVTLYESDILGSNYIKLSAPLSVTNDATIFLPDGLGSNGQLLGTSGSGVLTWNDTDFDTVFDFTNVPSGTGGYKTGATLVTNYYGTSPSATAGNIVSLGTTNVVNADADLAQTAKGFLGVVTGSATGDEILIKGVIKMSSNSSWGTAKAGTPLYLSATAGETTITAPSTTGQYVRVVGWIMDRANSIAYIDASKYWEVV